jgi:hypothetical protein
MVRLYPSLKCCQAEIEIVGMFIAHLQVDIGDNDLNPEKSRFIYIGGPESLEV